jgi:hypothetical protein
VDGVETLGLALRQVDAPHGTNLESLASMRAMMRPPGHVRRHLA